MFLFIKKLAGFSQIGAVYIEKVSDTISTKYFRSKCGCGQRMLSIHA